MIGAKSAPNDAAAESAPAPQFLEYFPTWRWALIALGFGFYLRDSVQTVADYAYRRGLVVGRREQLIVAVLGPDDIPPPPQPYCNATGGPGCQLAIDQHANGEPAVGCGMDDPCHYAVSGPQLD